MDSGSHRLLPLLTVTMLVVTAGWVSAGENLNLDSDMDADLAAGVGDEGSAISADGDAGTDDDAANVDASPEAPDADVEPAPGPVDAPNVDAPTVEDPSITVSTPDTPSVDDLPAVEAGDDATATLADQARDHLPARSLDLELAVYEGVVLDPTIVPLLGLGDVPTVSLQAGAELHSTVAFVKSAQQEIETTAFGTVAAPSDHAAAYGPNMVSEPADMSFSGAYNPALETSNPTQASGDAGTPPSNVVAPSQDEGSSATVQSRTAALPSTLLHPGTTAALAAAAAGLLPYLAWVLYHRIRGHAVLNNPTRKTIYDRVCEEPGLGVKELADAADVSYSTASYHLDRLRDADMVVVNRDGNRLSFYQNGGAFTEDERELLPLLQNCEAMRVLEDILENPGTYRARIAERLGVTATTINWHLKNLLEAGLVEERREGRTAHLFVPRTRLEEDVLPLLEKAPSEKMEWANPVVKIKATLGNAAPA